MGVPEDRVQPPEKAYQPDQLHVRDLESGHALEVMSSGDTDSAHDDDISVDNNSVARISTHQSLGPDNPVEQYSSFVEIPDSVYDKFSLHRKTIIVCVLSFCSFLAPISSTSVLAATPEVVAEYGSSGSVVNLANALYMFTMGISPIVWGPLSEVYGRRLITVTCGVLFFGCSIGTALAPNLAAFFIFRILTAFEGTCFILVGSACIADIYRPTERATAVGWFMSGTLIGPAFGPFLGGIIVTYQSWRVIFWLQTALSGIGVIGLIFLLPETIHHKKADDLIGFSGKQKVRVLARMVNPIRVLRLYRYPNLIASGLASSCLVWNMYSLLTPIRYVINPRFNLTTPMQGGLFYLAPGCGYILGTFFGGRYADYTVRRWIGKRDGVRVPEDRMRSALPFMAFVMPACILIYGWAVDREVGGIPLVVIALFVQGCAQLFCFPSLNTYCLDVMQSRGSDVIAGNYFLRYLFGCAGTAVVLPAIDAIGVGWFSTISAAFLLFGALLTAMNIWWGKGWRDAVDQKRRAKRVAGREKAKAQLREAAQARQQQQEEEEGKKQEQGTQPEKAGAAGSRLPSPATREKSTGIPSSKADADLEKGVLTTPDAQKMKEEV